MIREVGAYLRRYYCHIGAQLATRISADLIALGFIRPALACVTFATWCIERAR